MENFLNNIYSSSSIPAFSAFLLGLMTAISPCPLATNITAIGYIGKNLQNRHRVFYNGLIYTLGRALSYTALAAILLLGASPLKISSFLQQYGEKFLGFLLIVIGFFLLEILKINWKGFGKLFQRMEEKEKYSYWDVLLLGMLFALAFCPYSGVLYFGMLIPMTLQNASGLYLPVIFAIATGIPVIIFAWLLAYTVSGVGNLYNRLKVFEVWFRRVIGVVFIGIGTYYVVILWF